MKVVFVTFFRESAGGGVGQVSYEIALAFAEKYKVLFVNAGDSMKTAKLSANLTKLQISASGEGEVSIPNLDLTNIKYIFKILKRFSPDIIHAQDFGPISFLLQIWAKENGIPFLYTTHILPTKLSDFGPKDFSKELGRLLDSRLLKNFFLNYYNNCDAIIALNNEAEKDIKKFGYKGKIFIVPNGRNLQLYFQGRFVNILAGEKRLVFVGWLAPRKNQKYLLEVMHCLPANYSLDLVGSALSEGYVIKLNKIVKKYGLKNVNFIGKVEHFEIPKYLQKAHVFMSASKIEVQSLAVMEALASGTPVVGLSNETIDEFIDERVGFRFPKKTPPKIFAGKIEEICNLNQESYERLCQNARKKVTNLDWKDIVEKTVAVYKELIELKKKRKQSKKRKIKENDLLKIFEKINLPKFLKFESRTKESEEVNLPFFSKADFYIFLIVLVIFVSNSFYRLTKTIREIKKQTIAFRDKSLE